MEDNIKKELQSIVFERLLNHLNERKDVQNIDLMNLAGFCRNCLSKWYREEAEKKGIKLSDSESDLEFLSLRLRLACSKIENLSESNF